MDLNLEWIQGFSHCDKQIFLPRMLRMLLCLFSDETPGVQARAVSALDTIGTVFEESEESGESMTDSDILQNIEVLDTPNPYIQAGASLPQPFTSRPEEKSRALIVK